MAALEEFSVPLGAVSDGEMSAAAWDYWFGLIDEDPAADFLDQSKRTLQAWRQRGGGPKFVRLSARAVKYRRVDLRAHAEARLVTSTSDPGSEVTT